MGIRGCSIPRSPGQRVQGIRQNPRVSLLRATGSPSSQMLRRHHGKRHQPSRSSMENSCQDNVATGTQRGNPTGTGALSAKNSSTGRYGLRTLMGRRGGFLRKPPAWRTGGTQRIISGAGQKRDNAEEEETMAKKPRGGPRPVISMPLSTETQDHRVRILLDTGCSIPLLSQKTAEKLGITLRQRNPIILIENFMGQTVEGAGQYYTEPLLLRH